MSPPDAAAPASGAAPGTGGLARSLDVQALERQLRRLSRGSAPWLHGEVARRMAERLAIFRRQPVCVLDWWARRGGSGPALAAACPSAQRIAVEPAPASAPSATVEAPGERSAPWWSARRWHAKPAPPVRFEGEVARGAADLLWANMCLHFAREPVEWMHRWREALQVDGLLMFSTLGPGSLASLRRLYREHGWGVSHAPFVDMHDLGDMLVEAGFADPVMDQEIVTLTWANPDEALAELRTLGGNADPARFGGCRTPRWRDRLGQAWRERSGVQAGSGPHAEDDLVSRRVTLEFEVVYGHAVRPQARVRVASESRVGIDEMRGMLRRR